MGKRRSIDVEGFKQGAQPVPAASRIRSIVMTGGVYGSDSAMGKLPDDVDSQATIVFENLARILSASQATF